MKKSLLGELAERFVTQKENLASEALNIILNKSALIIFISFKMIRVYKRKKILA